jgi:hypothetical protein
MKTMLKNLINSTRQKNNGEYHQEFQRNLMRKEAIIGGKVFGPVPEGHRREFFCLDEHTWVWHEEWVNNKGEWQSMTTRYEVRPTGLIKVQNGNYRNVSKDEAKRFKVATDRYFERVNKQLYEGIA